MNYAIIFIVLFILELIYFKIADKYNIIDKPNHRSSHSTITLRGGGIIFVLGVIIAYITNSSLSFYLVLAVLLSGIVSFIDDIVTIPSAPRFAVHVLSTTLVFFGLNIFEDQYLLLIPILYILFIGWINIFNFMDGINGIMVLYSFVNIITFYFLSQDASDVNLLIISGIASLIFAFFNVRKKAKTFSGDIGSISLAIILGYFLTKFILIDNSIVYLLFISVFGIDASVTIFLRLLKKENIFSAHRTHLYQLLANELKYSHLKISFLYAIIQAIINIIALYLLSNYNYFDLQLVTIAFLLVLLVVYVMIRKKVNNRILALEENK
ncbi:MAG: UDP-GlcNAc--UDP-phosphate GlcNAc-1-phosphate transferase [Flavobacteriales bacterium]|nr:UDP-GlcNAc--UDP-phosphate GlcNAc-1-phosphate transferase [Flavobacteriales bacterium]